MFEKATGKHFISLLKKHYTTQRHGHRQTQPQPDTDTDDTATATAADADADADAAADADADTLKWNYTTQDDIDPPNELLANSKPGGRP